MDNFFARRAARAGAFLGRAVTASIGQVSWQPPGWLRSLSAAVRAHRLKTLALLLAVVAAAAAGRYYDTHRPPPPPRPPPPRLVAVTITAPGIPPLADKIAIPPLTLHFDASAAALPLIGTNLAPNLVRLDPALPGVWRWDGDRQLVFSPTQPWPAATTYHVHLDPAAFRPRVRLADSAPIFSTRFLNAEFAHVEFYQNPKDPAVKQVTATLLFNYAVDPAGIERHLSVRVLGDSPVFGSPLPAKLFSVTPGRHGREFFLRTVPLTLPAVSDTMKWRLAADLPTIHGESHLPTDLTATVRVPDIYSLYHIKETTTCIVDDKDGNPQQFLFVETTCLVRSEDLAKTLELYALPAVNPARHPAPDPAHPGRTDAEIIASAQAESDSDDDDNGTRARHSSRAENDESDTDESDDGDDSLVPGNHDGRFHNDEDDPRGHNTEGTEPADAIDAPDRFDDWSPSEVNAATLSHARRLPATLVPSRDERTTTHTFRLSDDKPGNLFVKIRSKDALPAPGGYRLRADYTNIVPVPVPDKSVTIQGNGGILALSGERKLSIVSRGVPAIRYEIARVPAAEINHLASQTRGDFQQPEFRNNRFNEQDLARFTAETQSIHVRTPVEANYSTFDFTSHLRPDPANGFDREGLFFLTASAWDPKTGKYIREIEDSRFVLVTDLGLLVKRNADGSRDIFAASLATGLPIGGVDVTVLSRSGSTLVSGPTDASGRVTLPDLGKNPLDSREPVAIVARRGGDVSFLPYERQNRSLDFSRFPIDGIESRTGHELDAFVFTERGVYRPGDTLHVGVIIKARDWSAPPSGLPLETEVIDARETSVQVRPMTLPASGFTEWTFDTAPDSPTGGYTLNVYLRRDGKRSTLLGSTEVQVKEFLPDRLKLDVSLSRSSGPNGHGWVAPEDLRGSLELKNLYGTAASDRLVKAHLRLNPRGFAFKEFPDYTFYDRLHEPKKDWEGETIELGDSHTDANGKASFDFDLNRFADVTYRLTFDAEGFEAEGGRSVEDLTGVLVSPLPSVVGWRADGDLNWINVNGPGRTVNFIALDRALNRIPLDNLTVHLAEQQYLSVLTKDNDGSYRYESVRRERSISDQPFPVPAPVDPTQNSVILSGASPRAQSKDLLPPEALWLSPLMPPLFPPSSFILHPSSFSLPHSTPGTYVLELRDASNQTVSRLEYTVVGQGHTTRSLEKNAELEIKLPKDQYRAGDDIEISITAPYAGSGLITIERERVYAHRWFKSTGTTSVQKITIPPDFDGTGYVNVSFVRALDSKEIFMSPLSYAVAPFTANLEHRRLNISLLAPEKTKPGDPLSIRYHTDRPAKIAVFAVDQGILQVTKFPLPDPLAYQFRKAALTVRTSQIMDLLLPEFSILRSAQSTGGDGDPGVLNPFRRVTEKPVVYWSGVIDADTTERTLTYPVPDYFSGTLTIMAVAASPDALGAVKTTSLCRNAFVLTPGLPTLAAPGDEFEVGLTVANGQTGSGRSAQVAVQAEPSSGLQIVRAPSAPLPIPEGREASTTFRVRALDRLGSATLAFRASCNGEDSRVHATLSIRPAMPFRTLVTSGNFRTPSHDIPVSGSTLYSEHRRLDASVSALPLGLARGLERYLKEYPHGCSEQITSGAFARLALADVADFGLTRAEAAAQIEQTITVERRRQNDAGGFGFWTVGKTPDIDFVTVYVMHFLSEAKAAGYPVPEDVFQKGLDALRRCAAASPWSLDQARVQSYAIYVLTREGVVTTNNLLTLRDYLDTYYKAAWPSDLSAVYVAACWSMLKKDDEARRLIAGYKMDHHHPTIAWWDFYQPLCADAQYVTILARHFPDLLHKLPLSDFQSVLRRIGDGDFSTLSAAYAVLALKSYSQAVAHNPPHLGVSTLSGPSGKELALSLEGKGTVYHAPFPPAATLLRFHADGGDTGLGIFYQATQSGFSHVLPTQPTADGIEVHRDLLDADGKLPVTRVKLGDRVTVRLRLRSIKKIPVTNVALLDLLPGGFEIADNSLQPGTSTAGMDYVDVREDRSVFYGTATNAVREITYRIKPTARGEFTVPPVFAEGMYDKKIQSIGLPGHITVLDAK